MATQSAQQLSANRMRLFKDRFARYGVTAGGVMVLVALLLIFFYLLYVVQPIFESVSLKKVNSFNLPESGQVEAVGMEEQAEIGYRFLRSGELQFFSLIDKNDRRSGDILLSETFVEPENVSSFAKTLPVNHQYAYGLESGEAVVVEPKFSVTFPETAATAATDKVERVITPRFEVKNDGQPLVVDENGRALEKLSYETDGDGMLFAAAVENSTLLITHFVAEENFMTGAVTLTPNYTEIPLNTAIDDIVVTPDLRQVIARRGNRVHVFDISISGNVTERELLPMRTRELGNATGMYLLAGASSVLLTHDTGKVSQWFEVPGDDGRQYQYIRSFDAGSPITEIEVEYYRRTFYTLSENGDMNIFHTTAEADLYRGKPAEAKVQAVMVDPRANYLLMKTAEGYGLYDVDNEHPEVSWSGLWQEVWYEGYPEPDYTWQSTSGSDDFESKFSLVPISFGTIKAAAYAMLFAVPIGLAAAVYTAYFMSPSVRRYVKPTVEIMEALPTVILGFLAGLWLAPLVEAYLPGFVAVLLLVPLAIILMAALWSQLPTQIKSKVNDGRAALLLIPVVLAVGWFSFEISPWVEQVVFDGDARRFITNELGVTFDQRNSLVVGIAMGFAVIPTIFSIAEDAVFSVPKHLSNGSLALGATPWQTLTKVVLLTASPGIFSAVMMGLGRAVGETMIVLMATGNTPIMDWNIFEGMRTLSANIAVEMPESEVGSSHYRILFLAAFVLFIFTFFFNTIAEFVRQRLRDKYSSM
ncbi:ABC transporter permease subunit [Idiomarina piscisalsi]|uniref:Phosphate ABC transporter permease n=1 Tax=Idiomarina piscisalsi TaxID=1096243 RepID=A0A432YRJ4_9GAMM|nr:ABC transporter permease subunit [Idiomarina piscisalsi]RUO64260.1 phosphate ABC transporter permease [Idiomarina piscisalsi]